MFIKDAVSKRNIYLRKERGLCLNELANISVITPSTVYGLVSPLRRDVSVSTVKKLCNGLKVALNQFFSTPELDTPEQKIR